jgi:nitrogen regulatory protein PII
MKLIRGYVREASADVIARALEQAGASGITVMSAHGRGTTGATGIYRGRPYRVLLPMCVIEVIASDASADDIVRVMVDHGHTGHPGDGHVLVLAVDEAYSVRTRWRDVA